MSTQTNQLARLAPDYPISGTGTPADPLRPRGKEGRANSPEFVGAALRRKRLVWTEAKDARLRELVGQGVAYDLIATDMSIEFDESIGRESIKNRCWNLRIRKTVSAWSPEIDADLSNLIGAGISYSQAATILNAKFGTSFTRNALIGRASRLGGYVARRPKPSPEERAARKLAAERRRNEKRRQTRRAFGCTPRRAIPRPEREITVLRCAAIEPHHVSIIEVTGCRWPYGDNPFTFCNHPKDESHPSYCTAHFNLSVRAA